MTIATSGFIGARHRIAESQDGTTVPPAANINASPTAGSPGSGNVLTISGGTILNNGSLVPGGSSGVTTLYYLGHTAFQFNGTNWYGPITAADSGSQLADPHPTVALSKLTVAHGSASGTVVGVISVVVGAGTYAWTYTLSGTNAGSFSISGSNLLTSGALADGPYAINIIATNAAILGSPFTKAFSVTVGSSAPPQAVAAGFTNVVFFDDFTADTVLANSASATSETAGKNWYWAKATSTANASVNTTATAASISNGNTGGGSFASSSGGILTLNGVPGNSGNRGEVVSVPQHTQNGVTPSGARQHYYAECYAQFTANGTSGSGWMAFWSWSLAALWGENSGPAVEHTEIDMAEYYSGGPAKMTANTHEWAGDSTHLHQDNFFTSTNQDSEWHLLGCLWTGNGTTGQLTFYRDNVSYGTVAIGSGTNYPAGESSKQYIVLSAGQGWPVNIDYIRIYQ